jgi:hypothetical protein
MTGWMSIVFIRRKGCVSDDAQDPTQACLARPLAKGMIAAGDKRETCYRALLRADCQHFLLDDGRRNRVRTFVLKTLSIDADDAESR